MCSIPHYNELIAMVFQSSKELSSPLHIEHSCFVNDKKIVRIIMATPLCKGFREPMNCGRFNAALFQILGCLSRRSQSINLISSFLPDIMTYA